MKKRIVGIASLPEREECLKETIDSLYNQVDKIIIGLNNYDKIPNFLNKDKIESYLLDNSLGDAAKFYKIEDYKNHYYFTCDDDIIYPDNYCDMLIEKSTKLNSIVGVHGVNIKYPFLKYYLNRTIYHFNNVLTYDLEVDILGTGTCLIDTSLLDLKLETFKIPNMADIWLADFCKKNNIKLYTIERKMNWLEYNSNMKENWTIYDHHKGNDKIQTNIIKQWK